MSDNASTEAPSQPTDNGAASEPTFNSVEEARRFLQQDREARLDACQEEVAAILRKHRCSLEAVVLLRTGQALQVPVNMVALD